MRNITTTLLRYLDATQHLWNAYFLDHFHDIRDCEPLDSYEEIDRKLFLALVCKRLGITEPSEHSLFSDPMPQILIKPKESVRALNVRIADDPKNGTTSWNLPISIDRENLSFLFVCFFQWDHYGFQSRSQVKCKIATARDGIHVGRVALVDLDMVHFFT